MRDGRRGRGCLALVPVVLLLTGCAGGPDPDISDACHDVFVWVISGQEDDAYPDAVATAREHAGRSDEHGLEAAIGSLEAATAGDPEARQKASAEFLETCDDLGWATPEG
ncbi:hypothetical protein [Cellulomonas sp. P5_C6]